MQYKSELKTVKSLGGEGEGERTPYAGAYDMGICASGHMLKGMIYVLDDYHLLFCVGEGQLTSVFSEVCECFLVYFMTIYDYKSGKICFVS